MPPEGCARRDRGGCRRLTSEPKGAEDSVSLSFIVAFPQNGETPPSLGVCAFLGRKDAAPAGSRTGERLGLCFSAIPEAALASRPVDGGFAHGGQGVRARRTFSARIGSPRRKVCVSEAESVRLLGELSMAFCPLRAILKWGCECSFGRPTGLVRRTSGGCGFAASVSRKFTRARGRGRWTASFACRGPVGRGMPHGKTLCRPALFRAADLA